MFADTGRPVLSQGHRITRPPCTHYSSLPTSRTLKITNNILSLWERKRYEFCKLAAYSGAFTFYVYTSAKILRFLPLFVCLSVCLSVRMTQKLWTNFDEFFLDGWDMVTSNMWLDFDDNPDHDADQGFLTDFYYCRMPAIVSILHPTPYVTITMLRALWTALADVCGLWLFLIMYFCIDNNSCSKFSACVGCKVLLLLQVNPTAMHHSLTWRDWSIACVAACV